MRLPEKAIHVIKIKKDVHLILALSANLDICC